jgi:SAM-dependent methyltransferase
MTNSHSSNPMHEANRRYWEALARRWQALRGQDRLWEQIPSHPELAFDGEVFQLIGEYLSDLHGKRAAVIGSGYNYAAFALAGMGARVTSSDISQGQLQVAAERAALLRLEINFQQADAAELAALHGDQFDLVCSSNGFFVWIAEPGKVFSAVQRVLKASGYYIFYDVHPFQRPWKDQRQPIEMEKPYTDTGPYFTQEDGQPSYEFHWRLSDLLNPLLASGLQLVRLVESPARDSRFWQDNTYLPGDEQCLLDWQFNPRAGLPVWLTIAAQKPTAVS